MNQAGVLGSVGGWSAGLLALASPAASAVLGASPPLVVSPLAWLLGGDLDRAQPLPLWIHAPPGPSPVYSGEERERLTWREPFGPPVDVVAQDDPQVWELVRVQVPAGSIFILEKVATYLRGNFGNNSYINVGEVDPYPTITDPAGNLSFAWILGYVQGDEAATGNFLAAAPLEAALPLQPCDGIPVRWQDMRYPWGANFTGDHQIVIQGPAVLRLFGELASPARWSVRLAGLLGGYLQNGGRAAAANAGLRS